MQTAAPTVAVSKKSLWTGRIITGLTIPQINTCPDQHAENDRKERVSALFCCSALSSMRSHGRRFWARSCSQGISAERYLLNCERAAQHLTRDFGEFLTERWPVPDLRIPEFLR
jgi:hypothetical protein